MITTDGLFEFNNIIYNLYPIVKILVIPLLTTLILLILLIYAILKGVHQSIMLFLNKHKKDKV